MGWEVQHFQDVEVIRHNGEVPGYTADMFLVPQKNLAVAMVMNTYGPMLEFGCQTSKQRAANVAWSGSHPGLRIPLYADYLCCRDVDSVAASHRRRNYVQSYAFLAEGHALSPQTQIARYVALPLIWNAAIAYLLLVTLPKAFEANSSTVILFQPDIGG